MNGNFKLFRKHNSLTIIIICVWNSYAISLCACLLVVEYILKGLRSQPSWFRLLVVLNEKKIIHLSTRRKSYVWDLINNTANLHSHTKYPKPLRREKRRHKRHSSLHPGRWLSALCVVHTTNHMDVTSIFSFDKCYYMARCY